MKRIHSRSDKNRARNEGLSFLRPHTAVLPESDAGSSVIKPASTFVIQKQLLGISPSQQAWHRFRAQNHGAGSIFTIGRFPFVICPFRSADTKSGKVVQTTPRSWHKRTSDYLRTHLKDHTRYDRGPKIHCKSRRVSLPVGKNQLAGCLRV